MRTGRPLKWAINCPLKGRSSMALNGMVAIIRPMVPVSTPRPFRKRGSSTSRLNPK